jgi:hypothetical protein
VASLRFSPETLRGIRNFGADLASPSARAGGMLTGAPQQSLPNIFARNVGTLLGRDMRTPQERIGALVAQGTQTPEQRMAIAAEYAKFDPIRGMQLMEAERRAQNQLALEKQERERIERFKESLIARNKAIGGSEERGNTILEATEPMLLDIRKEILAEEQAAAAKNAGSKGRLAIGKQAGLTEEQVKELSSLTDDQFGEVISGVESTPKAYKNTKTGSTDIYRVNRFSMVGIEKPNGATEWEDPLDLDLVPAVKETKDIGRANELTKQLAAQGTKDFGAVTEAARQAYRSLDGFAKRLQILDDNPDIIAGGKLSQLTVDTLITLGSSLGVKIPATASAEEAQRLMALGVDGVAQTIKAFGAGTGLSDADRLFAQFGAGATLELTAANIREMIEIAQKGAEDAINLHQGILDTLREENASEASLALFRAAPSMPTDLSPYYSQ